MDLVTTLASVGITTSTRAQRKTIFWQLLTHCATGRDDPFVLRPWRFYTLGKAADSNNLKSFAYVSELTDEEAIHEVGTVVLCMPVDRFPRW